MKTARDFSAISLSLSLSLSLYIYIYIYVYIFIKPPRIFIFNQQMKKDTVKLGNSLYK